MRIRSKLSTLLQATTVFFAATLGVSAPAPLVEPGAASQARMVEAFGELPLSFEVNQGQTDSHVKFMSRGPGYTLFLTSSEAVLALSEPTGESQPSVLRMQLIGANPAAAVTGLEELPGKSNYFIGNDPKKWRVDVPHYARVLYKEVYAGVDLVYYGKSQRQLEYDFIVIPGANPDVIRFGFEGADNLTLDAQGNVILQASGGDVIHRAPVIYQEINGTRQTIPGRYVLKENHQVGFRVAAYDGSKPLIIDPALSYSSYLGGSGGGGASGIGDSGTDIAVDSTGSSYVIGFTPSLDFPTTTGGIGPSGGDFDVFVTKLNATGSSLIYSTYLGGSDHDFGWGITLDVDGNAYVTGSTDSTDFPTTVGAFQTISGGDFGADVFVTKLNITGSALVYSTYLGSDGSEIGNGIAVDSSGNAYVTGRLSVGGSAGYFGTEGAFQETSPGASRSAFVTKLNAAGSARVYSTYLGSGGTDHGNAIAVDADGNAYVTGRTDSQGFPLANPFQEVLGAEFNGATDAFVTKLNAAGSALVYSTYLGGTKDELGSAIAVDTDGSAFVTGETDSPFNFPTTPGAYQEIFGSGFVTKFNPQGSALVYSTKLVSTTDIALDPSGNAYVTGTTSSPNFPTVDPFQETLGGGKDAFVMKISQAGSALVYSSYLGGSQHDAGNGIAVDEDGNAYVTGSTSSTDFSTTEGAFQTTFGGNDDAFVAKIGELLNQPPLAICQDVIASADANCQASADVDAGSFDPDDDPFTLSQEPPGPYGLGDTLVTMTVTDEHGASDSCLATVTVEDTTPPELAVTLTPDTLWPPNHRMVDIEASVIASDLCSTPTTVVLTSVSSNEADNAPGAGDGNTINDIQDAELGAPDFNFKLRVERAGAGAGNGRIYTAIYTATDAAGNADSAAGFAVVPHDQGGMTDPLEIFLEENGGGTLVSWNEAPAQSFDVIRGQLSNIVETDVVITLGPVTCIEPNSTDESTAGSEDSDLPNPAQAFFYLVEYDDGTSSTYGTESADKPRVPGPGDCQ